MYLIFVFVIVQSFIPGSKEYKYVDINSECEGEESIDITNFLNLKDTLNNYYFLHYDKNVNPYFYKSSLTTPVCETGVCKLVNIDLYWDLAGDFIGFDLDNGELTKINHEPFTDHDYQKLKYILNNKNWPLANYPIRNLIIDSTYYLIDEKVDGYSGATASFINADDNIQGALYTVYTLWHHVNNQVLTAQLKRYTISFLNDEFILKMLASDKAGYQKMGLENLSILKELQKNELALLVKIILEDDAALAENAIEQFPLEKLEEQRILWSAYANVSDRKRNSIIQKFSNEEVLRDILVQMSEYLFQMKSYYSFKKLFDFICLNADENPEIKENLKQLLHHENQFFKREANEFFTHYD